MGTGLSLDSVEDAINAIGPLDAVIILENNIRNLP